MTTPLPGPPARRTPPTPVPADHGEHAPATDRYAAVLQTLSYEEVHRPPENHPPTGALARPRSIAAFVSQHTPTPDEDTGATPDRPAPTDTAPVQLRAVEDSAGHRAAARLLGLRDVALPAAVAEAAAELLMDSLEHADDEVTRRAIAATIVRLRQALTSEQPGAQ